MEFSSFDVHQYRTLSVPDGYREWVPTYEQTVQDEMDLRLLARIKTVNWSQVNKAIDLACGTGRIGLWLKKNGVKHVAGLDITPAMLAVARQKDVYQALQLGNMLQPHYKAQSYDLSVVVLADEHLSDLAPLYLEVARITEIRGYFVIVGYHPHFLMNGIITHFHRPTGDAVAIESYVHLLSDHVKAAHQANWTLVEMDEGIIDEAWLVKKPKWEKYLNRPVSFAMVWHKKR